MNVHTDLVTFREFWIILSISYFLALFYMVLYTLKKAEIQLNPKYTSTKQILRSFRRHVILERVFLFINICIPLFYFVITLKLDIYDELVLTTHTVWVIYFIICACIFLFNIGMLIHFSKMTFFYISILGEEYNLRPRMAKAMTLAIISFITIALIPCYLFNEIDITVCFFS